MKIKKIQREKLAYYLKEFYKNYPSEVHTIFKFVRFFKARLKNNKDAWIGVSGDTGVGKSLFVIMAQILLGRPYDLTKNISYMPSGDEISDKFKKLKFNTFLVDEAAKEMRAVNWQSKAQQKVNVAAMTDRYLNNMVFLNMPNFNEFTKSMRRSNLLFRVVIPYRTKNYARVIVQRKSRNWRSPDPWGDELANERYEKYQKKYGDVDNELILKIERSLPNTIMDFIVPNLELILPEVTTEYERLKIESRKESAAEEKEKDSNVWRKRYNDIVSKFANIIFNNTLGIGKKKVTQVDLAKELGVSQTTIRVWLNKNDSKTTKKE